MIKIRFSKHNIILIIFIFSFLVIIFGVAIFLLIQNNNQDVNSQTKWVPSEEDSITSASEFIVIENRTYSLGVYLWYDYMPSIDPDRDGIPLYINIEIIPQDSIDYPENLIPTRIWLMQEDMFISRILPEESDISNPNRLHKVVHNGPKDLNGDIDVYIQLIYENSEIFYLVSFNNSIQYTS